ncbi:MAG: type II toxin-antitoxin system RelE/ParE family toxin [Actinomycetota bacterium]|nr:type II toxin-antitoxin system RelE/ParE family toxin [Actinomycetota bacterium]
MTSARLRPLAQSDLIERTRYYRSNAGDETGERFFDAAVSTLETIESMPGVGSLLLGELSDIPGLRSYRIAGFPCGWFYFERDEYVDVIRLLSYAQDLPALLFDIDG